MTAPKSHKSVGKCASDVSPDFAIGETVTIIRFGIPPYIEGIGRTVKALGGNRYAVRFFGEQVPKTRVVLRELQNEPEKIVAIMTTLWRAETAMSSDIVDFFPDDF